MTMFVNRGGMVPHICWLPTSTSLVRAVRVLPQADGMLELREAFLKLSALSWPRVLHSAGSVPVMGLRFRLRSLRLVSPLQLRGSVLLKELKARLRLVKEVSQYRSSGNVPCRL